MTYLAWTVQTHVRCREHAAPQTSTRMHIRTHASLCRACTCFALPLTSPAILLFLSEDVLLLDEVSMIDVDCFRGVMETMSVADHTRRPEKDKADQFGCAHVILFGDFKQLPPATSKARDASHTTLWGAGGMGGGALSSQAPFIVLPYVIGTFEFRVLRQNRRVVKSGDVDRTAELEKFHRVLNDISWGVASEDVRSFIVESYARGASSNCAEQTPFEGSTGVFTKRRYRDRFNRKMVKRSAATS